MNPSRDHRRTVIERGRPSGRPGRSHTEDLERAVHAVSSPGVPGGSEAERSADAALRRTVDLVCSWSDAEALAAFRDRVEPAG